MKNYSENFYTVLNWRWTHCTDLPVQFQRQSYPSVCHEGVCGSGGITLPILHLAPDEGKWSVSFSGHFTPSQEKYSLVCTGQEAGWAPELVWALFCPCKELNHDCTRHTGHSLVVILTVLSWLLTNQHHNGSLKYSGAYEKMITPPQYLQGEEKKLY